MRWGGKDNHLSSVCYFVCTYVHTMSMLSVHCVRCIHFPRFAVESGVHKSTFDGKEELIKVASADPKAELLLRIRADDEEAYYTLGSKFGATLSEAHHLLDTAQQMGVNVIGVR